MTRFSRHVCENICLAKNRDTISNLTDKTSLDFLVALRDAIADHKTLWDAGVPCQNVDLSKIFYRKSDHTTSTFRGVLIDLDLGTEPIHNEVYPDVGTRAFQSIVVLENGSALRDYLDDLESFFWVLFWITREQVGPRTDPNLLEDKLKVRNKMEAIAEYSSSFKEVALLEMFRLKLQPGWDERILILMGSLADFLFTRVQSKKEDLFYGPCIFTPEEIFRIALEDYSTVLGYFDTAIDAIRSESPTIFEES
ncbi:hypothetical protein BJ165DRAFT_1474758 [Panaeolus papilionaceus]|nr:hypothetical protein BJ165DRAFT_1474758 [Panaeolus papilionaceus]